MILFNNTLDEALSMLENEKELLKTNIDINKKQKLIILNYMQNFANSTNLIDLTATNTVMTYLDNLKKTVNFCNENISLLENNINNIDKLISETKSNTDDSSSIIKSFNTEYVQSRKIILDNSLKVANLLSEISEKSEFTFIKGISSISESELSAETIADSTVLSAVQKIAKKKEISEEPVLNNTSDINTSNTVDNISNISESISSEANTDKTSEFSIASDSDNTVFTPNILLDIANKMNKINAPNSTQTTNLEQKDNIVNDPIEPVTSNNIAEINNEVSNITNISKISNNELQNNSNLSAVQNNTPATNAEPNKDYEENTLVVSEISKTVVLPYNIKELEETLSVQPHKYSSIDEIIEKQYTLPISQFKNPFISRFKEAFRLMRNREHTSITEAFELGLELMFNYNLHPAIIAACKNLDELDIYLDYLESGEQSKFHCFKILFKFSPTVSKKSKKNDFA